MNAGHSEYWDARRSGQRHRGPRRRRQHRVLHREHDVVEDPVGGSQYGNEPYRTLITYKESLDSAQTDPADPPTWTGAWRDPRFSPPGDGGQPENALTGQLWIVNCCSYRDPGAVRLLQAAIVAEYGVASLQPGQTATMPGETLGYEWDEDVDNGFRPAGEIDMSQTMRDTSRSCCWTTDEDIGSGTASNSLTLYRAASGALVFDAGTVQWAWGLNRTTTGTPTIRPSPAMQQATVNLLADMGAQPATLDSGPGCGDRVDRPHPAHLDDHLAVGRSHVRQRQHRHDQRHRHRLGRRRGRGRRGLHRRRLDLASRDHDVRRQHQRDLELHVVGGRRRPGDDRVAGDR